jgi:hypothetical protein
MPPTGSIKVRSGCGRAWSFVLGLALLVAPLVAQPAAGQLLGRLKDKLGKMTAAAVEITLPQLVAQDPLATGIGDIVLDASFLDYHTPQYFRQIAALPKSPTGGWVLRPGTFGYFAQSYCLKAGTHRPSSRSGNGYAYAPLKGPQAEVVHAILNNSDRFPDIPQKQIQYLLWSVISRAKLESLSPEGKAIAAQLMTPAQLAMLNRNGLDLLPGDSLNRVLAQAPPAVRRVLEAQARVRELVTRRATYEDLERVAVLPEDVSGSPSAIPRYRWSYHPAGYFVRYLPFTYSSTYIQIDVPGRVSVETDSIGRILSLSDGDAVLRISYDDTRPGEPYPGAASVQLYRMRSVHFERPDPPSDKDALLKATWSEDAAVLVGIPPARKLDPSRFGERYDFARNVNASTGRILASLGRAGDNRNSALLANLVHLQAGLSQMLAGSKNAPPWTLTQLDLVEDAWQYTLCRAAGACAWDATNDEPGQGSGTRIVAPYAISSAFTPVAGFGAGFSSWSSPAADTLFAWGGAAVGSGRAGPAFDAGGGVAQPGSDRAQRIGQSQRFHPQFNEPCGGSGQMACPCESNCGQRVTSGYCCRAGAWSVGAVPYREK